MFFMKIMHALALKKSIKFRQERITWFRISLIQEMQITLQNYGLLVIYNNKLDDKEIQKGVSRANRTLL